MLKQQSLSSLIPSFYKLNPKERILWLAQKFQLSDQEAATLLPHSSQVLDIADHLIENNGGIYSLPLGFATNFRVNDRDYIIPLAIEESSVVAAASHGAKLLRNEIGISVSSTEPIMEGQIQILDASPDLDVEEVVQMSKPQLLTLANEGHLQLLTAGGGAKDLRVRKLSTQYIVHLVVHVGNAMGANVINTMVEKIGPKIAELVGGTCGIKIVSNLCDQRLVTAKGIIPVKELKPLVFSQSEIARRIEYASRFAEEDPYRAATHNKGIMNGIDGFLIAMGQDFRAIEAGAHAYAARNGKYTALSQWRYKEDLQIIEGTLTLPLAVGTVGGVYNVHPVVKVLTKITGIYSAKELACVAAAVGLAQNFSALYALTTVGIQKGHMRLHAKNIALMAGAETKEVDTLVTNLLQCKDVSLTNAQTLLHTMRNTQVAYK